MRTWLLNTFAVNNLIDPSPQTPHFVRGDTLGAAFSDDHYRGYAHLCARPCFRCRNDRNKFQLPKNFDAKEYFADAFGIIVDEENFNVERVEVKVMDSQREYLRTLPLHSSQQETETADDYSVFTFRLRPTFDFVLEFCRYGSEVEVLALQRLPPQGFLSGQNPVIRLYCCYNPCQSAGTFLF